MNDAADEFSEDSFSEQTTQTEKPVASMLQGEEPFFGAAPVRVTVDFGACSHPGKVRARNEDHFSIVRRRRTRDVLMTNLDLDSLPHTQEDAYVMMVADGIGGSEFGQIASQLALRAGWELGGREIKWPMIINQREAEEFKAKLNAYARLIHAVLVQCGRTHPQMVRMGTTLTAAYLVGQDAFVGHIGDSRCYGMRGGRLYQLTRDHTLAQALVDAGASRDQTMGYGHLLTNCLGGQAENVTVEIHQLSLQHDDRLLICSDGLTDMVDDQVILQAMIQHRSSQAACDRLLELALQAGGRDNVTILIGRVEFPAGPSADQPEPTTLTEKKQR